MKAPVARSLVALATLAGGVNALWSDARLS